MIMVTTANVTDRNGAIDMVDYYCDVTNHLSILKKILVDGGYTGENFANAIHTLSGADVEVMAMVYMWKLAGEPEANRSSFSDVSVGSDVAKAVDRAVEKGITSGISQNSFSPDTTCTRGQIVTFLFRASLISA